MLVSLQLKNIFYCTMCRCIFMDIGGIYMAKFIFQGIITPLEDGGSGGGCFFIFLVPIFIITTVVTACYSAYRYFDFYVLESKSCDKKHTNYNKDHFVSINQCESLTIDIGSKNKLMQANIYGSSVFIPKNGNINDRLPARIAGDSYSDYGLYVYDQNGNNGSGEYLRLLNFIRSEDGRSYEIVPDMAGQDRVKIEHLQLELAYGS
jgi:hypothetical protein